MKTDRTNPKDIDAYIASHPKNIQEILEKIRATIQKAAPAAQETIKYQMPTFTLNGNLVHFAAYKSFIGLYPAPREIVALKEELSAYKGSKSSVQFPIDKPIPLALITKIVKLKIKKNVERAKPMRKKETKAKG